MLAGFRRHTHLEMPRGKSERVLDAVGRQLSAALALRFHKRVADPGPSLRESVVSMEHLRVAEQTYAQCPPTMAPSVPRVSKRTGAEKVEPRTGVCRRKGQR